MCDDDDFISIQRIEKFSLRDITITSVAFKHPLFAFATSAGKIVIFNSDTSDVKTLQRQTTLESVVLCSDIDNERSHVATGHSNNYGGEVVLWSLKKGEDPFSFRTTEGVTHVVFGTNSDTIFHSDSNGILYKTVILTTFFGKSKSVKTDKFFDFQGPLVAMALHNRCLFVSSSSQTRVFRVDFTHPDTFWSVNEPSSCFAFLNVSENEIYVARGFGYNVIVSTFEGKDLFCYKFSKTPNIISFIDLHTILILFKGNCEMVRENVTFHKAVPPGISLASSDRIFIAKEGADLLQLSLTSAEQRVEHYKSKNNWKKAFEQIISIKDVQNIDNLFNEYISNELFNPDVLFECLNRIGKKDFIIEMKFNQKEEIILNSFIESEYTKDWKMNEKFVYKIVSISSDPEKLSNFLLTKELNFNWMPTIYQLLIQREMFITIQKLSIDYSSDYVSSLFISHYLGDYEDVFKTLEDLLIKNKASVISYLQSADLTDLILFDFQRMGNIILASLEYLIDQNTSMDSFVNHIIQYIDKDNENIWVILIPFIISKKIIIDKDLIPCVENFIYASKADQNVRSMLLFELITSSQINNDEKVINLVRASGLESCELELIILNHNLDGFFSYINYYNITTFTENIQKIVKDLSILKDEYVKKAVLLMNVNPDEFCKEILRICSESNSTKIVHDIYNILKNDTPLLWNFTKRIFVNKQIAENATPDEIITCISYLADYNPSKVYSALKTFGNIPLEKALDICRKHGIVDATLYLYGLYHDFEGGFHFGMAALETSLMENQDPVVLSQICNYIMSTDKGFAVDSWLKFLESFQIPVYVFLYDAEKANSEKLEQVLDLLYQFLDSMIRFFDSEKEIISMFIQYFSFLPFKVARELVTKIFSSVYEKKQFSSILVQIEKLQAANTQMMQMIDLSKGKEYDGIRCANCGKLLGQCDAIAFNCGHVFHEQCASVGWCRICDVSIERNRKEQSLTPDISQEVIILDNDQEDNIQPNNVFAKKK